MADRRADPFDRGAWESFRSSLPPERREDVRRKSTRLLRLPPPDIKEEDADPANGMALPCPRDSFKAWKAISNDLLLVPPDSGDERELRGSYMTHFGDEREEIDEIIEILALKDPKTSDYPRHWDEPGLYSHTKKAISNIFFAEPSEPVAELLKQGLVLLEGQKTELMLFTDGFLSSRGDWDKFARGEIQDYFQGMGKTLNDAALDKMLKKYDCDYDGTLSKEGFKVMLRDFLSHPKPGRKAKGISWWSLGDKLNTALEKVNIPRKLHAAFEMADIEKIVTITTFKSNRPQDSADSEGTHQALAVHIKGVEVPLMVTCKRYNDVDAWAEAFATCSSSFKASSNEVPSNAEGAGLPFLQPNRVQTHASSETIDEDGNTVMTRVLYTTEEHDGPESTNKSVEKELTEEEQNDNAAWRQRFKGRSVFGRDYVPQESERKEMDAIVGSLALKNSNSKDPDNPGVSGHQITEKAIDSIFFTEPGEPQSVLLKRGPVLLNGEERELAVFTHGFLFSHVELNALSNLLLDKKLTEKQMVERFREIDVDHSRELDRDEVNEFFRGMGVPLSKPTLDHIMDKYDSDSDGMISWNEFKGMMHEMKEREHSERSMRWGSLRSKLKVVMCMGSVARKLDVAYQMTDIEKIENLGVCHSSKTGIFADSKWAHLTLAVHIKGKETPILVTCAKPGHVEAWMEAFHACIAGVKASIQDREESNHYRGSLVRFSTSEPEEFDPSRSGMISGILEEQAQKEENKRHSLARWSLAHGSAVDWGYDSEDS